MRYAIVIEKSNNGFTAFVPDLPGCVAAAESEAEVRQLIRESIELHIDGVRESGEAVPPPSSRVEYVDVPTAG